MIRIKKAAEAKKEAAEQVAAKPSATTEVSAAMEVSNEENAAPAAAEGKESEQTISLLGIGGKQIKVGEKKTGKKKTPGEIRIQKGNFSNYRR